MNIKSIFWKKVCNVITPGGDPLWECPICEAGRHLYGVEYHENYTHKCSDCGAELYYPWEIGETKNENV